MPPVPRTLPRRPPARLLLWAALAVAAAAAPVAHHAAAAPLEDYRVTTVKIGGPFTLIDQAGERTSLRDFRGKAVVLAFGFTHCPDICPATVNTMSTLLRRLGPRADRVRMVFVSVDPERDTPARLKAYLGYFHPDVVGLTGPLGAVRQVARLYKAPFRKLAADGAGGYQVGHVSFYYLIDTAGQVVYLMPHSTGIDTLLDGIAALLKE